jgi:uncharacterized membrane protein (DUF106 family)
LILFDAGSRTALVMLLAPILAATIGFGGTMPVLTFILGSLLSSVISIGVRESVLDWVEVVRAQKVRQWLAQKAREATLEGSEESLESLRLRARELTAGRDGSAFAPLRPAALTLWFTAAVFTWCGSLLIGLGTAATISLPWTPALPLSTGIWFLQVWTLVYGLLAFPPSLLLHKWVRFVRARERLGRIERVRKEAAA